MKRAYLSLAIVLVIAGVFGFFLGKFWAVLLTKSVFILPLLVAYMWMPGVIGLVFARNEGMTLPVFRKLNKHYFLMPLCFLGITVLSLLFSIPFADMQNPIAIFEGKSLIHNVLISMLLLGIAYFAGLTVNMLAALGEELYWRGYLWEKWKILGARKAIVMTGIVWGIWHWPLIYWVGHNYPNSRVWGCLMMVVLTLLLSFIFTYYRLKVKAIMVPAAIHGTINATGKYAWILFAAPNALVVGMTGGVGLVLLFLFCLFLKLFSSSPWKKLV